MFKNVKKKIKQEKQPPHFHEKKYEALARKLIIAETEVNENSLRA